jgi:hypothetical protein
MKKPRVVLGLVAFPGVAYAQTSELPQPQPQQPQVQQGPPVQTTVVQPAAEAQRTAHNAIFLELLGNGLIYSVNYERIFDEPEIGIRAGLSFISLGASAGAGDTSASSKVTLMTFPVLANYYGVGSKNHKLQLGAGVTFLYASATAGEKSSVGSFSGFVPAPTLAIGYRYLPEKGGFNFFVGFTPFIIPGGDHVLFPWGGISFGGIF